MQALRRARELRGAGGFYALQAATIACHAEASTANDTDWSRITAFYSELAVAEGDANRKAASSRAARSPRSTAIQRRERLGRAGELWPGG
jgi:predicted RNA polymerase sigma factor